MPSRDGVGAAEARIVRQEEQKANNRLALIREKVMAIGLSNMQDPRLEIIEIVSGIKEGQLGELLGRAGFSVDETTRVPGELPEKADSGKRVLPVYNADGTRAGIAQREEEALKAGFAYKLDDEGKIVGFIKPDVAATPGEPTYPVMDKSGLNDTGRRVTVAQGKADTNLEPVEDDEGKIKAYKERLKPRLIGRGVR